MLATTPNIRPLRAARIDSGAPTRAHMNPANGSAALA